MPSWRRRAREVEVVILEEAEEARRRGPAQDQSWTCAYCGALNSPDARECFHCQGPRP